MNEDNQNDDDKIVLDGTFKCPECGFREKHLASCSHRQYQDMPTLSGGQPWPCENLNKRPPRRSEAWKYVVDTKKEGGSLVWHDIGLEMKYVGFHCGNFISF